MKNSKTSRKKNSPLAGKTRKQRERVIVVLDSAPRRPGTRANKVYSAMMKIPTRGRTLAAARKAGYRSEDLKWDLARGHVRLN